MNEISLKLHQIDAPRFHLIFNFPNYHYPSCIFIVRHVDPFLIFNIYYLIGKVYRVSILTLHCTPTYFFHCCYTKSCEIDKTKYILFISVSAFSPIPPDYEGFWCFRNIYFKEIALIKLHIFLMISPSKLQRSSYSYNMTVMRNSVEQRK